MLANSRLVRGVDAAHRPPDRINAERAVQAEIARDRAEPSQAMDDPYLAARVDDVREVGSRLIRNLTKTPYPRLQAACADGSIVSPRRSRPPTPR